MPNANVYLVIGEVLIFSNIFQLQTVFTKTLIQGFSKVTEDDKDFGQSREVLFQHFL